MNDNFSIDHIDVILFLMGLIVAGMAFAYFITAPIKLPTVRRNRKPRKGTRPWERQE